MTNSINDDFLITEEHWSDDTIRDELSGRYGKTLLTTLVNQQF